MTEKEIISGLQDLVVDRESFINDKSDKENIFVKDKEILEEAINLIKSQQLKITNTKFKIESVSGRVYEILDNYKLCDDKIEISSIEELINLSKELKRDIIIQNNYNQEENSLLIYDDYLE